MTKKSLSMDVKVGDSVSIDGGRVVITVGEKSGQRARLKFEVDSDVNVQRVSPEKSGADRAARGLSLTPA